MKTLVLPKDRIDLFAAVLQQFGEVHAPVAQVGGGYSFRPLARWSEARLDYPRTILPPKKYFLPPRETLFRYRPGEGFVAASEGLDDQVVLFGVHACDVYGLNILDKVFVEGAYPDPYYATRRKNVAVIGIDCTPDEHCFCRSMRADFVDRGFDLFFHDLGDRYLVMVGTARGDDMVLATRSLFRATTADDVAAYKRRSEEKEEAFQIQVELRDLPEIFELEYESELWEDLGGAASPAGAAAWSARPATATTSRTIRASTSTSNGVRAPGSGCGTRASSPPTPWWPGARTSGRARRTGSSSASTTSSAASWPSTAGRAASGAGAASSPAPPTSTS